jgi:uncharacterized protein YqiB (DUF1249 family)
MRWPDACSYCESPKPGSLAALMELYEQNYMRLRCLCPPLRDLTGIHVSSAMGAHDLLLKIVDQARHTSTLKLTYAMENGDNRPDVLIRLCHDSVQAEVITRACRLRSVDGSLGLVEPAKVDVNSALTCRWRHNRFLYKWLNYVHRQGHQFGESPILDAPDSESFKHRDLAGYSYS